MNTRSHFYILPNCVSWTGSKNTKYRGTWFDSQKWPHRSWCICGRGAWLGRRRGVVVQDVAMLSGSYAFKKGWLKVVTGIGIKRYWNALLGLHSRYEVHNIRAAVRHRWSTNSCFSYQEPQGETLFPPQMRVTKWWQNLVFATWVLSFGIPN